MRPSRAGVETVLLLVGIGLLFWCVPHTISSDGKARFQALSQLLGEGSIPSVRQSMVGPILSAPLWFLGRLHQSPEWWCARYNTLVFAAGVLAIYLLLKGRADAALTRRFLLILVCASMFGGHLRNYFGEVFSAVFVGVGMVALAGGRPLLGSLCAVLGVVNTPSMIVGLAGVSAWKVLESRRLRWLALPAAALALILAERWLRLGSPWVSGYANDHGFRTVLPYSGLPGFSYPFWFGILSILFSFGKGLVWFAPGAFLVGARRLSQAGRELRASYVLWMICVVGLIVVYAKWWGWYGGIFWGPRFFLLVSVPASFALALRLRYRASSGWGELATLVALIWSFWVGINGSVFFLDHLEICRADRYALESLCWHVPEFSALLRPFVIHRDLTSPFLILIGHSSVVLIYLAAPCLRRISVRVRTAFEAWRADLREQAPFRF